MNDINLKVNPEFADSVKAMTAEGRTKVFRDALDGQNYGDFHSIDTVRQLLCLHFEDEAKMAGSPEEIAWERAIISRNQGKYNLPAEGMAELYEKIKSAYTRLQGTEVLSNSQIDQLKQAAGEVTGSQGMIQEKCAQLRTIARIGATQKYTIKSRRPLVPLMETLFGDIANGLTQTEAVGVLRACRFICVEEIGAKDALHKIASKRPETCDRKGYDNLEVIRALTA